MKKLLVLLVLALVPSLVLAQAQNLYIDKADASIVAEGAKPLKLGNETNGVVQINGRLLEDLTIADVNAQNNTLTVAQAVGGVVVQTSVTGAGTVTADTAAHYIAGSSGSGALTVDGQCYQVWYINDGTETLTLAADAGATVTIGDTGQTIAANESALLLICRTSSTAVTIYHVGA